VSGDQIFCRTSVDLFRNALQSLLQMTPRVLNVPILLRRQGQLHSSDSSQKLSIHRMSSRWSDARNCQQRFDLQIGHGQQRIVSGQAQATPLAHVEQRYTVR
jgi:hypothetical protein